MNKKEKNKPTKKINRDERLEKIRSFTTHQSEEAAQVLKMWLNKAGEENR